MSLMRQPLFFFCRPYHLPSRLATNVDVHIMIHQLISIESILTNKQKSTFSGYVHKSTKSKFTKFKPLDH